MQAHTLGEVDNLGTVSLRVSSGTIPPIFIEVGSYLTDKEQKISWHSFFETRCSIYMSLCVQVDFKKQCGTDDVCHSNLKLRASLSLPQ